MKNLLKLISLFVMLVCIKSLTMAQCFNEPEEVEAPESTFFDTECTPEFFSKNGRYLPTKGIIRILVVFAEIDYSYISGSDPTGPDGTPEWPAHQLPDWADDIGNPTVPTTIGEAYGLTKYFLYASSGEYTVLVDYLVAPTNGGIFSTTGREPEHIVSSVNSTLGSSIVTNSGLNSINYFDLWTTNTSTTGQGKPKITPSNENPRRFDHIMFIWRNKRANNGDQANNTGSAHSSSPGNMLGFDANTYTQNISYDNLPLRLLRHEYGHLLYGGNNFHCSGGGTDAPGYFQHLVGGWSNMSLHDGSLLSWNAWDRQRMDWKVTGSSHEITARNHNNSAFVNGDLDATNPAHAGTYSLRDFVIYGDALRIKLPYIDPDNEFEQFLWIENHRGIGENNVEFDKWMHEHNACVENLVPGMYAYKQIDRENRAGCTSNAVYSGHADYLRPLNANGHWDRALELTDNFNDCVQWGNTKPFIRTAPNPLTGLADMDRNMEDLNDNNLLSLDETSIFNYTEKIGSTYHKHLFNNGHTDHAFTRFGKNKIGISTNPSSANVINLVRSGSFPTNNPKDVRKIYLNGVSIEIIDYHSGVMKVEIRFDDVDVEEDVRWCGEEIILNPISSPSGYSLNIKEEVSVTLDQGLTATRMNNPQTFNGEKIFVSNTLFRALDQSHIHLEENSNFIVDNNSEFRLESGSRMDLEDGARLIVKRGGLVYVEPGAAILLAAQGKIIIEHGGKMIVDGGLVSKLNEDPWLGIEVWGTSNESQFNEEFFGILELKNGAEISYADNAVSLWKSGDYNNTGGIILSSESYFYNNRRSVEFVTFQNTTQGGAHHKNLSEFHLTQFLVDDGYIDTGGNPFYSHVTLWDVDGVEFKGCGFINYQSNLNSSLFHNNGIKSIDASYHVKEDDISYVDVSSFIGHNFGIIATGTGFNSSVFVHSAAFKGNFCGFLADNVKNFEFINSNLILGGFPLFTTFNQVGVVSNESTGYQISGNLFERGNQTTASTFGTHIVNSGEDNNFVFNNKFDNLTIGSNSAGINKSSNTFAIWDGLRYICNKYYNSSQSDLSISTFNSNPTYDGISSIQGDINSPASAGNIFTQPGVNPNGHINNLTTNAIRYVHHGGTSEPIFYTNSNVFLYNYSANSCEESPYFFGEEEFELNNSVELISSEEIIENLSLLYNSLIDNGNTDAIIYNIEHNWNESDVLLSNLLLISPFLSFDAFSASVRKNLLNPNQVIELCVSNPELTYHPEFYNLLEEYHYTTINFLLQLVNENNNFISERGLLEWNILNAKSKLKMSTDQTITKELKKESINIDFIRSILQNRQSLSDLYMLAESYYLHSKDFTNGELILLNIPHEKVLAAHQLADYHEYMKFFAFQKRINEQSRYISQLEPNEILELEQFSNSSSTRVSSRAKNILCFFYEICETYDFGINSLQANSRLDSKIIQHMKEEIEVKVFPNPASNYALINWSTEVESFNGTITIKDLSAKTVSITSIKSSKGVWQWDTTEIPNGFYIYEFSNDNRVLTYGKIVIQK